jgi:hypothetical protein
MFSRSLSGTFLALIFAFAMMPAVPAMAQPAEMPDRVTATFYEWYTGYPASNGGNSPLADHAYRQSPYLTTDFVERVDGILTSFTTGGFDPFLCAQDVPERFEFDPASISDGRAKVTARGVYSGGNSSFAVGLRLENGAWKIWDVTCAPSEVGMPRTGEGDFDWSWIVGGVIALVALVYIGAGIMVVMRPNTK